MSKNIKVLHLSHSDGKSGAGIAASRIHESFLNNQKYIESYLRVNRKFKNIPNTIYPKNIFKKGYIFAKLIAERKLVNLINFNDYNFHSLSIFPSRINIEINNKNTDIVNLHWIQHEMISIEAIKRIKKPIIWTLHDAWPFLSTSHYPDMKIPKDSYDHNEKKYIYSFSQNIDEFCISRKLNAWKMPLTIICPSTWLAESARKSKLMRNCDIFVIPNPLNTSIFRPIKKIYAREKLNIPSDEKVIAFGAIDGFNDLRKGGDLLMKTLEEIDESQINMTVIIFGNKNKFKIKKNSNLKIFYSGLIFNEDYLALIYSAADLMIVPSRQESFGQTASEAMSCGTPVIAYNYSGLIDIVDNNENGILIDPYDYSEMSKSIIQILNQKDKLIEFGENARKKALREWSYKIVSEKYKNIYMSLIKK